MAEIPEFVYLVTVDTEWPISVIVDYDHGKATGEAVERKVEERRKGWRPDQVKVYRARLAEVVEMELIPTTVVPPGLRERD